MRLPGCISRLRLSEHSTAFLVHGLNTRTLVCCCKSVPVSDFFFFFFTVQGMKYKKKRKLIALPWQAVCICVSFPPARILGARSLLLLLAVPFLFIRAYVGIRLCVCVFFFLLPGGLKARPGHQQISSEVVEGSDWQAEREGYGNAAATTDGPACRRRRQQAGRQVKIRKRKRKRLPLSETAIAS